MWKKYPKTNNWYKTVSSGFLNLTFVIRPKGQIHELFLEDLPENYVEVFSSDLAEVRIVADQHIKHALRWA